jgi:hypothetical protein
MSQIGRLLPVTTVSFLAGYFTPRPSANGTKRSMSQYLSSNDRHQNIFHHTLLSFPLNHLDMSTAQLLVKENLSLERPPIVKKNLQWAPHGNPTDDRQTFARDVVTGIGTEFSDSIGPEQTQRDEHDTDGQAHAALLQKMFQGTARLLGFVGEVVVDRSGQHLAWVAI